MNEEKSATVGRRRVGYRLWPVRREQSVGNRHAICHMRTVSQSAWGAQMRQSKLLRRAHLKIGDPRNGR